MAEQFLKVNGAELCYEVEGSGPYIVFVAGGNGGHRLFKRVRDMLTKYFTVVLYDRRGYFRSKITGPQEYSKIVETNVEDLHKLMKHITDEKFILFGISGSGPIVFKYLIAYPETLIKIFIHEPLYFLENFPDIKKVQSIYHRVYRLFRREDRNAGMKLFGKTHFNELDYQILIRNQRNDKSNNWDYWLENECCEVPFTKIDMDLVKTHDDKVIFLHGAESRNYFVAEPGVFIAKYLGKETLACAGGHIGFYTHTEAFTMDFTKLCRANSLLKYQPKL